MNPRTLAQLRTSVLARGQYEGSQDIVPLNLQTGQPNFSMLNEFCNVGIQEYYEQIVAKWADYYTLIGQPFSTVFGQQAYQLDTFNGVTGIAPGFFKSRKVEVLASGSGLATDPTNRWKRLRPTSLDGAHGYSTVSPIVAYGYRYFFVGTNLMLWPIPMTTAATIRLWYIPYFTKLVNDSDSFDFVNGWEELAIQCALIQCKRREELPTDDLERERDRQFKRVMAAADGLDAAEPFYLDMGGPGSDDEGDWGGGW